MLGSGLSVAAWRKFGWYAATCALLAWPCNASAFEFFGLFGDNKPPAVSPQALPYLLTIDVADSPSGLKGALEQASVLYRTRQEPPVDGEALVRRAEADLAPLIDALWGAGYYNGAVTIEIAGLPITVGQPPPPRIATAANSFRNREAVPISIKVQPGPLFSLRTIAINDPRGRAFTTGELPPRIVKLAPGDPARAADIRAAQTALVDHFRAHSYPLAKVTTVKPTVYHQLQVMDVAIAVDTGPQAPFGEVSVSGQSAVNPAVVRSHIYIEPGDPYSPEAIARSRRSVLTLPAISSIRIREADRLDAQGQLPINAEVTDRKPNVIGFSARYSTLDGPALRAYWQNRNLWGGAESLRLEGDIFVPPRTNTSAINSLKNFEIDDLGGRFRAAFVKPALGGSRKDLLLDGMVEKDRTG
ncbi:MAG: hypothetical protein Q8L99_08140, partial [Polycyclovorans sp.]|nr:hypothetical protein [Polycyclovorans sp.]